MIVCQIGWVCKKKVLEGTHPKPPSTIKLSITSVLLTMVIGSTTAVPTEAISRKRERGAAKLSKAR